MFNAAISEIFMYRIEVLSRLNLPSNEFLGRLEEILFLRDQLKGLPKQVSHDYIPLKGEIK